MATEAELQAQLDKITAEKAASDKEVEKWKAMSRKNEDDKKANAEKAKLADDLQAKLDAAEASKLTEAEKAAKSIADLAKSVEDLKASSAASELAALRVRVGAAKGVPAKMIDRLRGNDETSIAADADEILTDIGAAKKGGNFVSREGNATPPPADSDAEFAAELFGGGTD